jgi:hypothetical protein
MIRIQIHPGDPDSNLNPNPLVTADNPSYKFRWRIPSFVSFFSPSRVSDEVWRQERQDAGALPLQAEADGLGADAGTQSGTTRQTGSRNGHRHECVNRICRINYFRIREKTEISFKS